MTKLKLFEEACIEIKKRDGIKAFEYKLQGANKDKAVTLKASYSKIAANHLYFESNFQGKVFSWQQITDACIIAGLYVTDVVSHHL